MSRASPVLSADGVDLRTHGGHLHVVSIKPRALPHVRSVGPAEWHIVHTGDVVVFTLSGYTPIDLGSIYADRAAALAVVRDDYLARAHATDEAIWEILATKGSAT